MPEQDFKALRKTLNQFKRKSDGGNKAIDRITAGIEEKISDSVSMTIADLYNDFVESTPRDSIWLAHNWDHSSGAYPATTFIPTPMRPPYPRGPLFDEPPPLNPASIDGTKKQYVYNSAEYAEGYINVEGMEGEALDEIVANFENGKYLKRALKANGWRSK